MTDDNDDAKDDAAAETPIQRALRMKKAAADAKPTPPRDGHAPRKHTAGLAAGKSKPWLKR